MTLLLTEGLGLSGGGDGDLSLSNVTPATSFILPSNEIEFDITDSSGTFSAIIVVSIVFPNLGYTEVVWDGVAFKDPYSGSTRTPISGGYHYHLVRSSVWHDNVHLRVRYTDTVGNAAELQHNWTWAGTDPTPPLFTLTSIQGEPNKIRLVFPSNFSATGAAAVFSNYVVTPLDGGIAVTVTGLTVSSNQLILDTTDQSDGKTYQLDIPVGLVDTYSQSYIGPSSPTFLGDADDALIAMARSIDAFTVEVIFKVAVNPVAATEPANYSIDNDGEVLAVTQVSDREFRLTTSKLEEDFNYTVTTTGIGPI